MSDRPPPREISSSVVIPPRPIRNIARDALTRVDNAMATLSAWGVRIPANSRLHKARDILAEAVTNGRLVPQHRGDTLGLQALELAFDYSAIAETLPAVPLSDMRRELRDSLKGEIHPPAGARGPLQAQSQGIVRAAFVSAGAAPFHSTRSSRHGKSPDVLLENGTLRYGIEAKRPEKVGNLLARFDDGVEQLRHFGLPGAVFMDLADCVRGMSLSSVEAVIYQAGLDLIDTVFARDNGFKPGYEHVMVAGAYARVTWSSEDDPDHSMVGVHSRAGVAIFAKAQHTLADHRAKWIRRSFHEGLGVLTEALNDSNSSKGAT